ncbi:MAG: insulinase family protein [Oscillospiraceae bacterium]|nr:insulinase family protein [Oscillospiraceae bacterium]
MAVDFVRTALAEGVNLSVLSDAKFKHNRLSVNLILPLCEETVSDYAVLPLIMRKGSKSCCDFTELNRRLDSLYGAALACDVGKSGPNQIVTLGVKILDDRYAFGGEKLLEEAAKLLREILFEPMIENGSFEEKSFELERQFLIDTIKAQINDKRSYAVSQCRRLMGKDDPAAIRKYGEVEGAERITAASAAAAYEKMLDNASIEIMLTGSGDPAAASAVMKKAFAGLKRHPIAFSASKQSEAGEKPLEQTEYLDVAQSKMVLGFRCGEKKTVEEQAAMRMMTALYGGTPSSKLFLNVREKLSLCYYCAARYDRAASIVMVDCGVEKPNIESAKAEILHQLDTIRENDFDDETFENTRAQLKNALRAISDYADSIEEWYLGKIIAGSIVSPAEEMRALEKVTREQVVEAAKSVKLDAVYLLTSKEENNAD